MRICGQNPRTNADATFQDLVSEQQRSVHSISSHYGVTKVVILGIEYRYRSLSSIEVSSIDVIAGIVLTLKIWSKSHFLCGFSPCRLTLCIDPAEIWH